MSIEKYWQDKLSGEIMQSSFAPDDKNIRSLEMSEIYFEFSKEISGRIVELSGGSDYAAFILLLVGVKYLLYRYTGNNDLVVGTAVFKDKYEDNLINNILAIRSSINKGSTFKELLLQVRDNVQEAAKNQNFPYDQLIELLRHNIDRKLNPLFNTMVLLENIQAEEYIRDISTDTRFIFNINNGTIGCKLHYLKRKLDSNRAKQIISGLIRVFEAIVQNMDIRLSNIDIHTEDDLHKILYEFNDTYKEMDHDTLLYKLIEQRAEEMPERIAVVYKDMQISYKELNEEANKLARFLSLYKLGRGSIVTIMMDRTPLMLESILALWKLGAAYIPVDPGYPAERINKILAGSNSDLLLTVSEYFERIAGNYTEDSIILIDAQKAEIQSKEKENLCLENSYSDLAYVIYTSGSTGEPKGAMAEQIGMLNHIYAKIEDLRLDSNCIIAQNASQCFDISVWQFFCALAAGGKTVIYPDSVISDLEEFTLQLIRDKVTVLEVVPSFLSILLEHIESKNAKLESIAYIVVTGEALPVQLVQKWFSLYPHIKMVNAYGPTEASDDITHYIMDGELEYEDVPIGKPIRNFNIYIADGDMNLCPIGVKGEILVSGIGVGKGYLNNKEATEKAFLEKDIFKDIDVRMYRTGDLGCRLHDGNIMFFGRLDHQVKVRGFRIELEEIEKQLLKLKGTKEAVAVLQENLNGDRYICAYLISDEKLDKFEIRKKLSDFLPEYMIPAYYIYLDKIPLTPNGKVDRKALPNPDFKSEEHYEAPQSDVQRKLAEVWGEVLGLENIGINDDFFEIGGDSIKAIQISAILQRAGLKLENADLFLNPTIKKVEKYIKKLEYTIKQDTVEGEVTLTPVQRRFFSRGYTESSYYNQAVLLYGKSGFDKEITVKAFNKLLEMHDALRMTFNKEGEEVIQRNRGLGEGLFTLVEYDYNDSLDIEEQIASVSEKEQSGMEIYGGNLLKLVLFKGKNDGYLLIAVHHLVIDGISWRVLLEDFETAYEQLANGHEIELPDKTTSYKEWADKLVEYAGSTELIKEADYWRGVQAAEYSPLPKDFKLCDEQRKVKNLKAVTVSLDMNMTDKLIKETNWAYSTETYDILLTALGVAFRKWCGLETMLVSMEGHGREAIVKEVDLNRTVGWFTSIYPFAVKLSKAEDLSCSIKQVKEALRAIPNKGIGYGLLRYMAPDGLRGDNKLMVDPEICFNYLGQFDENISSKNLFKLSSKRIGNVISPESDQDYSIEVICLIVDRSLNISFRYNVYEYKKERIEVLANCYLSNLRLMVEHCTGVEEKQLTPSDVSEDEELTIEQLDSITASLNM